jgi:hypothetical protein
VPLPNVVAASDFLLMHGRAPIDLWPPPGSSRRAGGHSFVLRRDASAIRARWPSRREPWVADIRRQRRRCPTMRSCFASFTGPVVEGRFASRLKERPSPFVLFDTRELS